MVRKTKAYEESHRVGLPGSPEMTIEFVNARGVIGIHEDLTLTLDVPWLVKNAKSGSGKSRTSVTTRGLGDVVLSGKWRFFKDQEIGGTTEIAAILGVKTPTGRDDERNGGETLPQPLQSGTGSWDPIIGSAFTRQWDGGRWVLNADLIYRLTTEANDFEFGDILRFDVGAQYRVYPKKYDRYDQLTINLILEMNGRYEGRASADGETLRASGGTTLFASPGVQVIVRDDLLFESGVQIPFYRRLHGGLGDDYRFVFGLRWLF